jgi:hypothetical protein
MKRIALAVAVVVMAAGACKKAQNTNAAADSAAMADTMKMMSDSMHRMSDSMKSMDTTKAAPPPAPARRPTRRP